MSIEVIKPGLLTSVQDGGRRGYASLGIGRAGAMDVPAWRLANALVGNTGEEATLELTLVGPTLRFHVDAVIALTGAIAQAHADEERIPPWTTCFLPAGSVLRIGGMREGCRGYLAVRGGLDVAPVLGSRSTDLHARIGPLGGRALQGGDVLALADDGDAHRHAARGVHALRWGLDPQPWLDIHSPLAMLRGHHHEALDAASQRALFSQPFRMSQDSNRTGARLDEVPLRLSQPPELISEATLPGTVQLPPSGQPIVLLAEAPVTGGYPRIGQLAAVDLPRLAQRRPGDAVCFRETSMDEATERLHKREDALQRLLQRIAQRLDSE